MFVIFQPFIATSELKEFSGGGTFSMDEPSYIESTKKKGKNNEAGKSLVFSEIELIVILFK